MKQILLFACLASCLTVPCPGFAQTTIMSGRIVDPSGASVAGAIVDIHWNMPRAGGPAKPIAIDSCLTTDNLGDFSISLIPGFYDVCVHALGFSPICETVAIGTAQGPLHKAMLKASPLIAAEYGDRFGDDFSAQVPTEPAKPPDLIPYPK